MPNLPLLLGHRGARASAHVAENSFPSFDLCLQHGCDGFEFDLRLTACGRALVCHDAKTRGISVSRATSDELTDLPRLEDVLGTYGKKAFLDIELKVTNLESKTLLALAENPPECGFVVSSFVANIVTELRGRSGHIPLGIICEKPAQLALWRKLAVEWIIPQESLVDESLVGQIHNAGKRILVWTVNQPASMLRLAQWGVDGIISDETALLVKTLRNPGGEKKLQRSAGNV